jgi:TetR/AcrR family transcriptional regulator, mexJK operon transcriptional repressor
VTTTPARTRGRPRGSRGSDLLAIARAEFLAHGFAGTTMSAIVARARVSKTSLYGAYPSKGELFAAVVRDWTAQGRDAIRPHLEVLRESRDVRAGLLVFAATLQDAVLAREVSQMRRLVAAEAAQFPEVAAEYLAESWDRNIAALAEVIARLAESGRLDSDDPGRAAREFTWMAIGEALNSQTLGGYDDVIDRAALAAAATSAVETFLARYGPRP